MSWGWVDTGQGKGMVNQAPLVPDDRIQTDDEGWLVASKSRRGTWHRVAPDGECDCLGYANRGQCRHVKMLVESGKLDAQAPRDVTTVSRPEPSWPGAGDGIGLWTSRYQNKAIADAGVVPVRASNGGPRFKVPYLIREVMVELAPDRSSMGLNDPPRFKAMYEAKLAALGVDRIARQFDIIRGRHDGRPLVLLCFEDVSLLPHPKGHCHRTIFAGWWTAQTGEVVRELADQPPATAGSAGGSTNAMQVGMLGW